MAGEITKEQMKEWLETAPKPRLANALVNLYERQTLDEQSAQMTKYHNGVGFSACDAEILSSLAEWWARKNFFTDKQANLVRRKLKKYCGQLVEIANDKIKNGGAR